MQELHHTLCVNKVDSNSWEPAHVAMLSWSESITLLQVGKPLFGDTVEKYKHLPAHSPLSVIEVCVCSLLVG